MLSFLAPARLDVEEKPSVMTAVKNLSQKRKRRQLDRIEGLQISSRLFRGFTSVHLRPERSRGGRGCPKSALAHPTHT